MSITLRRTVNPKIIDANKNETNLDSYTVDSECLEITSLKLIIDSTDTATKVMPIPIVKTYSMELISDQPVNLSITYKLDDCGSVAIIILPVMNFMITSQANTDLGFGILSATVNNNLSGYDATIQWRATGTSV